MTAILIALPLAPRMAAQSFDAASIKPADPERESGWGRLNAAAAELEPAKGTVEMLVVDGVERHSGN